MIDKTDSTGTGSTVTDSTNADPKRIIVGVDGSESSVAALRRAAVIAAALGSPLEAITTWEYPVLYASYYPAEEWSPEQDANTILATAIEQAFHGTVPQGFTQTTMQGPAARVLIEQSEHASMLVLGSRGHGGFAGLLLGSVSSACAEHAQCPVLIMHGAEVEGG